VPTQKFEISPSLQAAMLELSELGLLYRMVAGFVNSRQTVAGKQDTHGSMAEQVRTGDSIAPSLPQIRADPRHLVHRACVISFRRNCGSIIASSPN
jgi:hypothetical protein